MNCIDNAKDNIGIIFGTHLNKMPMGEKTWTWISVFALPRQLMVGLVVMDRASQWSGFYLSIIEATYTEISEQNIQNLDPKMVASNNYVNTSTFVNYGNIS